MFSLKVIILIHYTKKKSIQSVLMENTEYGTPNIKQEKRERNALEETIKKK